jgi:hypothetical protein
MRGKKRLSVQSYNKALLSDNFPLRSKIAAKRGVRKLESSEVGFDMTDARNGLLANGLDNIRHAMDHFSERNHGAGRSKHDDK